MTKLINSQDEDLENQDNGSEYDITPTNNDDDNESDEYNSDDDENDNEDLSSQLELLKQQNDALINKVAKLQSQKKKAIIKHTQKKPTGNNNSVVIPDIDELVEKKIQLYKEVEELKAQYPEADIEKIKSFASDKNLTLKQAFFAIEGSKTNGYTGGLPGTPQAPTVNKDKEYTNKMLKLAGIEVKSK